MSGPLASKLVLLNDLRTCKDGEKVRFLGCVQQYTVATGVLQLRHDAPGSRAPVTAHVQLEHVLERAKAQDLEVGAWVNVIGYVGRSGAEVGVQAVAMWAAGNVDLGRYEGAVERRRDVG